MAADVTIVCKPRLPDQARGVIVNHRLADISTETLTMLATHRIRMPVNTEWWYVASIGCYCTTSTPASSRACCGRASNYTLVQCLASCFVWWPWWNGRLGWYWCCTSAGPYCRLYEPLANIVPLPASRVVTLHWNHEDCNRVIPQDRKNELRPYVVQHVALVSQPLILPTLMGFVKNCERCAVQHVAAYLLVAHENNLVWLRTELTTPDGTTAQYDTFEVHALQGVTVEMAADWLSDQFDCVLHFQGSLKTNIFVRSNDGALVDEYRGTLASLAAANRYCEFTNSCQHYADAVVRSSAARSPRHATAKLLARQDFYILYLCRLAVWVFATIMEPPLTGDVSTGLHFKAALGCCTVLFLIDLALLVVHCQGRHIIQRKHVVLVMTTQFLRYVVELFLIEVWAPATYGVFEDLCIAPASSCGWAAASYVAAFLASMAVIGGSIAALRARMRDRIRTANTTLRVGLVFGACVFVFVTAWIAIVRHREYAWSEYATERAVSSTLVLPLTDALTQMLLLHIWDWDWDRRTSRCSKWRR